MIAGGNTFAQTAVN